MSPEEMRATIEEMAAELEAQEAELEAQEAELRLLRAPEGTTIFRGPKFNHAWGALNIFMEGFTKEVIKRGEAFQADVDELQSLVLAWLTKNPKMWTRERNGFKLVETDVLFTQAEPGKSLRRPVMEKLESMQRGSAKVFCDLISMLSEKCYAALAGPVYAPGADSGDLVAGFGVPACYAGKSGTRDTIPAAQWPPHVAALFKDADALVAAARKPGGKQIPGVPDLDHGYVWHAGNAHRRQTADYSEYQYAAAICQAAAFSDMMHAAFAGEAATVQMGAIKTGRRYVAKCAEYATERKSSPKGQHVKDIIRCMVQVAGHPEMKRAHAVLQDKCTVRSTKVRVTKVTHDLLCIVELEGDVIAEVQIGFTSVVAMKLLGHVGYQYARVDTSDLDYGSGLGPLFASSWFNPPSITKRDPEDGTATYVAGYDKVAEADLALVSLR